MGWHGAWVAGMLALGAAIGVTAPSATAGTTETPREQADALVSAFQQAFAGEDRDDKRVALRALAASGLPDAVVLPLLVDAVADRQAHDDAIAALRARTGLTPPAFLGQSHYPSYPSSDHPASWQDWLTSWRADHEREALIDEVLATSAAALADAEAARAAVRAAHTQSTVSTPTSSSAQP